MTQPKVAHPLLHSLERWNFNFFLVFLVDMLQSESKKEEFRRYLESTGVLDAFTKGSFRTHVCEV